MAHKRAVAQHQANPLATQYGPAHFQHGDALGGSGIAAAVVG